MGKRNNTTHTKNTDPFEPRELDVFGGRASTGSFDLGLASDSASALDTEFPHPDRQENSIKLSVKKPRSTFLLKLMAEPTFRNVAIGLLIVGAVGLTIGGLALGGMGGVIGLGCLSMLTAYVITGVSGLTFMLGGIGLIGHCRNGNRLFKPPYHYLDREEGEELCQRRPSLENPRDLSNCLVGTL